MVVSGLPNITPIFSRIWLMKIRQVFDFETMPVSLRMRLRHQPRLHAHVAIAHFAVELGLGHQRGHRIDHQHVDRAGGDQRAGDFERLLAVIRLRNQQIVDIHAQLAGVGRDRARAPRR